MKANRTIRYRLYPATYEKHQKLHGNAGACRYVWNHFVGKLKDEYEYYGESKYHSFFTIGKQFTILRKYCHTWLQNYSANIVKTSLKPIETTKIQREHIYIQRIETIENPGTHMKAKSGLNWEIRKSCWRKLGQCLSYKAHVEKVNPAYISQTCNKCGSVDKVNRKTQSIFKCQQCGHEDNADVNAALNILAAGNTVTGHRGSRVARPVKRANQLVKLTI